MNEEITVIYCVCKDLLDAIGHRNDPQCKVTDAEVCMLAIVAARLFGGNFEKTRIFLHEHGYMSNTISKSRMNRRIHHLAPILMELFEMLAQVWKTENKDGVYLIDSFPIPVCQNIRITQVATYYGG
ncbi:hypothetical protein CCP3SC5AM1_690007 [Gammaproteobacteria bacterium]